MSWTTPLKLQYPVVQAGMGGGIAGAELAGAVSRAGGLGTLGIMPPRQLADAMRRTAALAGGRPYAVNLLMPFAREAHLAACLALKPASVCLFYGFDRRWVARLRRAGILVMHQVGSAQQARRAIDDGAEVLVVQGEEAGGHLAGDLRLSGLLPALRREFPARTLLAAGGIHDAASAAAAIALGADGVVAGTRFLLTPESDAHPAYRQRLLNADRTLRTRLFGLGWPEPHRVVANAATRRWCAATADGPRWTRGFNRATSPARKLIPLGWADGMIRMQRAGLPLFTPFPATRASDPRSIELTPLYAGECVAHIDRLRPAAEVVAELGQGCRQ